MRDPVRMRKPILYSQMKAYNITKYKLIAKLSSVGRISEGGGVKMEAPKAPRWGRGLCPLPIKILHFLHQNHTFLMHSDTLLK